MSDDSETEGSDARSDPYQEDRSPSPPGDAAVRVGFQLAAQAARPAEMPPQLVERVAAAVTNSLLIAGHNRETPEQLR